VKQTKDCGRPHHHKEVRALLHMVGRFFYGVGKVRFVMRKRPPRLETDLPVDGVAFRPLCPIPRLYPRRLQIIIT
jgi:hypothetical protein